LAIIGNLQHEKEIIAIAKFSRHWKKWKVVELFPLDWWTSFIMNQVLIKVCRKCWVATNPSQFIRCSDLQGSGHGRESKGWPRKNRTHKSL